MADDEPQALVSLREKRERTIARLSDAFAGDELELDEFDRRLTIAHRAETPAELDALTADLAAAPAPSTALVPARAAPAHARDKQSVVAILGGTSRRGPWTPARKLRVIAVLGGTELDFREAQLAPGVTDVHVTACLGGASIIVPPTLAVEMEGVAILGGFEHSARSPAAPDPDRPLLRVHGLACLGGVHIETRLPGEPTEWEEHVSRRRELRSSARAQRRLRRHEE